MSNLNTFVFNRNIVRVLNIDNELWFVAKDLCEVLEIGNSRQALSRLDEDEKNTVTLNDGTSGNPNTSIVSESGMYSLVLTSRKAQAKMFKKWITSEVLPTIRKTGIFNSIPFKLSSDNTLAVFECDDYWVVSTTIAEVFDKRHDNVLRDLNQAIEELSKFEELSEGLLKFEETAHSLSKFGETLEDLPNFKLVPSTYKDLQGKTQKCYKVNRDMVRS